MPKTNEILFNLEGLKYDMSLDLNVVYYNIQLSKYTSNLCMIIIPWVKYCYERPLFGIANSQTFSNRR